MARAVSQVVSGSIALSSHEHAIYQCLAGGSIIDASARGRRVSTPSTRRTSRRWRGILDAIEQTQFVDGFDFHTGRAPN